MWIIKYLIEAVIPTLSAYLAADDTIFIWLIDCHVLSQNVNIEGIQKIFLAIDILYTVFWLEFRLGYYNYKEKQSRKEIAGLYNVIKQFAQSNFSSISKDSNFNFDLRIFVPEVKVSNLIFSFLLSRNKEKWFVIHNIEPFAKKDITEHLRFRVEPDEQGLVGKSYQSKSIVYDDNLKETNSVNYSLQETQVNRTSNLLWSICVPILDEKNGVIAVIAFDSGSSNLDITNNKNEVRDLTNTLSIMLKDSVPELFKQRWRI